jgi:hypothetical protein
MLLAVLIKAITSAEFRKFFFLTIYFLSFFGSRAANFVDIDRVGRRLG